MLLDDEDPQLTEPPTKKMLRDPSSTPKHSLAFSRVGGDGMAKLRSLKFNPSCSVVLPNREVISPRISAAPDSPKANSSLVGNTDAVSPQPVAPSLEAAARVQVQPSSSTQPIATSEKQSPAATPSPQQLAAPTNAPKKKMVQATLASFFSKKSP